MKSLIKALGSLSFALGLLASLVTILTVSTVLESARGTPFAQRAFYTANWFDVFLALLAVNIFTSALSRWPYKLTHTGFLITHAGILMLLAGSFMTRLAGVEGQISLLEGETKSHMLLLDPAREPDKGPSVTQDKNAKENHAVRFTLKSEMAQIDEPFWLVEKSTDPAFQNKLSVGLAQIELKEGKAGDRPSDEPAIRVTQTSTGQDLTVPVATAKAMAVPLNGLSLTVSDIRYFPDARVNEKNELVNESDEPKNPAVRFTLDDGRGNKQERTIFTLFPDFEAIHGRKNEHFSDIKVELLAPESELAGPTPAGLTFYHSSGGWSYESRSKKGVLSGPVKKGEAMPTGWMDFSFRVDELLDRAVTGSSDVPAEWLPFRLQLIDFRKKDYPGTTSAASYESDVVLEDPKDRVKIQKTIWMNHPLDYKGYRIFQSSYIQDPQRGETSVFTVAKNPGIPLIYGGALVIFAGIICVFYVKPLSYLGARSSNVPSKK